MKMIDSTKSVTCSQKNLMFSKASSLILAQVSPLSSKRLWLNTSKNCDIRGDCTITKTVDVDISVVANPENSTQEKNVCQLHLHDEHLPTALTLKRPLHEYSLLKYSKFISNKNCEQGTLTFRTPYRIKNVINISIHYHYWLDEFQLPSNCNSVHLCISKELKKYLYFFKLPYLLRL